MSALRDSGHAQRRSTMNNDSDSDSEDGLVEKLKLLSKEMTLDEKGYDLYLEQYLPLMGVHRSYAGQPDSKEYKIGYLHFRDIKEHGGDLEESGLSAFADRETPKSLGCLQYEGRVDSFEISKTVLACNLNKSSSHGALKPSTSMRFELLQRDVINVRLNNGTDASGYLLQPSVFCSSSSQEHLQEVTIRLALSNSEGCHFLAVQEAPSGAECVAVHDVEGKVNFSESTYAGKAPCSVLYVGHETAGSASCCMLNSTTAEVHLHAPPGKQAVSHLSAQLLLCIADDQKDSYIMRVSAKAIVVCPPPPRVLQLLPCTKEPQRKVYVLDKEVQINL